MLYRFVRHPLYVGLLFAFWSTPTMTLTHLLFAIATTAYILIAIQFEEHDLLAEHPEYEQLSQERPDARAVPEAASRAHVVRL